MYVVRDLNVEVNVIIKAGFLLYLLYGCLALPWGMLADKYGSTKALAVSMVISGLGAVLSSCATSVNQLFYSLSLVGCGIACAHPAGMASITKGIAQRGAALGTYGIWGSMGIISAPFIGGIGGYFFGWRNVLILSGCVSILAGLYTWRLKLNEFRSSDKTVTSEMSSKSALKCFLWLLLSMTLAGVNYRANIVTLPVYFEERAANLLTSMMEQGWFFVSRFIGSGENTMTFAATMLVSFAVLVGMFGQKLGGKIADSYDLRWGYFCFFLLCLPLLIIMSVSSGWTLFISSALFLMFSLGMQPIENSLVARLTPPRFRSTAYGIKFVLTFGLAALAVNLVAWCREIGGSPYVYKALVVVQILLLISIAILIFVSRGQDMKQYRD